MLSRKNRLKKERDFKLVYRYGKKKRGCFFDIHFLKGTAGTKFGIIATTKVIKKATQRNKAKRFIRGLISKNKNQWPQNMMIIIKIKREIKLKEKKVAAKEIKLLLREIC